MAVPILVAVGVFEGGSIFAVTLTVDVPVFCAVSVDVKSCASETLRQAIFLTRSWCSPLRQTRGIGNAGAYHLCNVALHVAATALLFLAFERMTRQSWRSALVAGIFALHPLHVESVAWISERKDVLSAFFGMLTLLFYASYAEAPSARRYAPMALAFVLGLMSKPMLVTLPFVLLLLDVWPLRRITWPVMESADSPADLRAWPVLGRLLLEKAPLLGMALAVSMVTILAHIKSGDMSLSFAPFSARLAYAAPAYATYLGMSFWPAGLSVFYPYHPPPAWGVAGAAVLLAGITLACLQQVNRRPWLLVGWLWYLGMLLPVIGLVKNGTEAMADRFMYLPMVGLSVAVIWGCADFVEGRRLLRREAGILAGALLLLLAGGAYRQVGYWRDSRTLYEHALAVTTGSWIIHDYLGLTLTNEGKYKEAIEQFRDAIAIVPDNAIFRNDLGVVLVRERRHEEAVEQFRDAIAIVPDNAGSHNSLGVALERLGQLEEAIAQYTEAVRLTSEASPWPQNNLCRAIYRLGRFGEAVIHCIAALRLRPHYLGARYNLATALAGEGNRREAAAEISFLLSVDPNFPGALAEFEKIQGQRQ